MKICKYCGAENPDNRKNCKDCGRSLEDKKILIQAKTHCEKTQMIVPPTGSLTALQI